MSERGRSGVPVVSVILPTHDRERSLMRAVDSVLAQSCRDFELIVVDDASTDATAALLAACPDPRLRVLHQPQRQGAAHARNLGIRAARADLIAFQDSDDAWLPRKLELQLALLRASPAAVGWIGGSCQVEGPGGLRQVRSANLVRGRDYEIDLLVGEPFVTPTWLVRSECLIAAGLFDESMPCLEDWDLIFKLADHCAFKAVDAPVLVRHASPDSLYGNLARRRSGLEVMLTRHRTRWLRQPRLYATWCAELGRLHALDGHRGPARRWLQESLRHDPWQPAAVALLAAALLHPRVLRRLARSPLAPSIAKLSLPQS